MVVVFSFSGDDGSVAAGRASGFWEGYWDDWDWD
jgi:hypothetical protein